MNADKSNEAIRSSMPMCAIRSYATEIDRSINNDDSWTAQTKLISNQIRSRSRQSGQHMTMCAEPVRRHSQADNSYSESAAVMRMETAGEKQVLKHKTLDESPRHSMLLDRQSELTECRCRISTIDKTTVEQANNPAEAWLHKCLQYVDDMKSKPYERTPDLCWFDEIMNYDSNSVKFRSTNPFRMETSDDKRPKVTTNNSKSDQEKYEEVRTIRKMSRNNVIDKFEMNLAHVQAESTSAMTNVYSTGVKFDELLDRLQQTIRHQAHQIAELEQ